MPSWGPFLPLEDALDPEFAMEHSGEGFITSEIMLGITTTESYNDFSASDIQVIIHHMLSPIKSIGFQYPLTFPTIPSTVWSGGRAAQSSPANVHPKCFHISFE